MHAWPRPFIACFALVLGACGGGDTEPAPAEAVVDPPALGLDLVLRPEAERETRLAAVSSWMYQLGGFESADAIATLDREPYEMVVVEPGHNIRSCAPFEPSDVGVPAELHDTACGDGYDYQMLVDELGSAPSGERRLVLAYIDVGQAEWYRDYWTAGWRPPTSRRRGSPSFILSADPDGWTGNFVVSYWDPRWRALWIGDDEHPGLVRELAALGYDGVYLDWIEAYSDETVIEAAESDGVDPADEMVAFVEAIRSAGRSVTPDFLVVAQNAPYLIWETDDSARYADTIDAFAAEDTWSFGNGSTEDWDAGDGDDGPYDISDRLECEAEACRNSINAPDNVCGQPDDSEPCEDEFPVSGDLHGGDRHQCEDDTVGTSDCWSTDNRLLAYADYRARDIPVFTIDYCITQACADTAYDSARANDLVPLVTRVQLSRVTDTPPFD